MSQQIYAGVDGHVATSVRLTVGNQGPWVAEVDFQDAAPVTGRVTLTIGKLLLSGTVDPNTSGVFGDRKARIVAGAGAWGARVAANGYHNDAGVKARLVAEDAARAVGESLGSFVPTAERLGVDYVRQAGLASTALEDALDGALWWVDYSGATQAGSRPVSTPAQGTYDVLAYDPRGRVLTLTADDPGVIQIGSVVSASSLEAPQTVRDLELTVDAGELRITAWCGGQAAGEGRLAGLLRAIVARTTDGHLFGKYRYRLVSMASDRCDLQAIRKGAGLPDLRNVSMWPGVAGAHAVLTPGAEVLVEFIEGDRSQPIVTHFAGKDGQGYSPVLLTLGGIGLADFVALATKVQLAITTAVTGHTHTDPVSGSTGPGLLAAPVASVAATKVQAV